MATLKASPEANYDRQTDKQTGRQNDKATYRGSSYLSAQKSEEGGSMHHTFDILCGRA